MIPQHIQQLLDERGYSRRTNDKEAICKTLHALGIEPSSELGEFYLGYHPSLLRSTTTYERSCPFCALGRIALSSSMNSELARAAALRLGLAERER